MPEKMDYIIIGVGVLAAVLISSYVPSLVQASSSTRTLSNTRTLNNIRTASTLTTLESIPGIDLNSLSIVRQKNLF